MKGKRKEERLAKQMRRREASLRLLKEKMVDLPDECVPALEMARQRLGLKGSKVKGTHASIMAHFDVVYRELGIRRTGKPRGPKPPVNAVGSPDFLFTYEWRKLRYQTLVERGAVCEACGRTPKDGIAVHVDHIKPRRHHPELALMPTICKFFVTSATTARVIGIRRTGAPPPHSPQEE